MTHVLAMLETHPAPLRFDRAALVERIRACFDCAPACTGAFERDPESYAVA